MLLTPKGRTRFGSFHCVVSSRLLEGPRTTGISVVALDAAVCTDGSGTNQSTGTDVPGGVLYENPRRIPHTWTLKARSSRPPFVRAANIVGNCHQQRSSYAYGLRNLSCRWLSAGSAFCSLDFNERQRIFVVGIVCARCRLRALARQP